MTTQLLRTKLAPPRLRTALVPRDALLARLDAGVERKLTLIAAPAGFGKTTLLRQWMHWRAEARRQGSGGGPPDPRAPIPDPAIAWISLDEGDNDPARFWRYVINACQSFQPELGAAALGLLDTTPPRYEAMLTALLNDMAQLHARHVLVLDDAQAISAAPIHELLAALIEHLPPTLHLVVLTRTEPALPLARLRARDELNELRAADLRFSSAETQAFMQQSMPIALAPELIARLEARTEGWVAGLRLAALALQGQRDAQAIEQVLSSFTGSHRHIAEYLLADVLGTQPAWLQSFLLQTSSLGRLNGSLCDAITGRDDSAALLEQLAHANLFIFPLDGAGQWYRYHPLFAEAMRHEAQRRLGEPQLRALRLAASHWYEQHELLAEAIDAALDARAFERATTLIARLVRPDGFIHELITLRRWVERLPAEQLSAHPDICLAYASAILFSEDRSAPTTPALVLPPLQLAQQRWRAEQNRARLGEALAFRSLVALWQGELAAAFAAAHQALELLPEESAMWRGTCQLNIGLEHMHAGQIDAARAAFLAGRAYCATVGNQYAIRAATHTLAELALLEGALIQAEQLFRQVLGDAHDDATDRGGAQLGLGLLAYARNDLALAEQLANAALDTGVQYADEIGRQLAQETIVLPSQLLLTRIQLARGTNPAARQALQALAAQSLQHGWERLHGEVLACQARAALADGDLPAVQRWATARAQQSAGTPFIAQERDALIVARLLIAQGDAASALRALDRWRTTAQQQGRARGESEILILVALAQLASGSPAQARQALLQALERCQAEGERRLFLDEGPQVATLLQALLPSLHDQRLKSYAQSLLQSFPAQAQPYPLAEPQAAELSLPVLMEPLSAQEQRVLRLLAAGLSNPEIADELVVSINTIKTQVQSIYRKLEVSSRKEARALARRMKLG